MVGREHRSQLVQPLTFPHHLWPYFASEEAEAQRRQGNLPTVKHRLRTKPRTRAQASWFLMYCCIQPPHIRDATYIFLAFSKTFYKWNYFVKYDTNPTLILSNNKPINSFNACNMDSSLLYVTSLDRIENGTLIPKYFFVPKSKVTVKLKASLTL